MGNQTYYKKSVETFLLKYLPQLNFKSVLNDDVLSKTLLCTIEDEGPVVCKFHFQKIESEEYKIIENDINKIKATFSLYKHPNILVYDKIFNLNKKALMGIRQFTCNNLNDKLHRIPKLQMIEKMWITFQLLCAVSQINSEKLVHGDIKPSNVLFTSYNWLFLSDHVSYKPTFLKEDDLTTYNAFFGEQENNLRCYLAPERFKSEQNEVSKDSNLLEPSMDIFSIGCIIAEVFMDGLPLFGLAQLQNYRKGNYDPKDYIQKKIKNQNIVDLILSMIDRDPLNRLTINQQIQKWNSFVFPRCFSQVYFQIGSAFLRPQFLFSDQKIGLIRKYIDSIWFACFGKKDCIITDEFNEPIEMTTFERLREDTIKQFEEYLIPSNELFIFLNNKNLQNSYLTEGDFQPNENDREGIIIIIHFIGCLISTCYYPQNKICALEMLLKIALNTSIEMRLQFILPYVITMLEDENSKVKGKAIEVTVMMFKEICEQDYVTTLTATDYKVFENYILPAFLKLKNESTQNQYVQYVFVRYLPLLAQIGHRFLELSVGSRFQKRQQQIKQNLDKNIQNILEDEEEKMFSQERQHIGRGTIIIRDDSISENKQNKIQDAMEVFVNYDTEYDKLRRIILSIINDILSETEHTLQRILFQELGRLSVFLGRKMSIDNLIPLLNSCFNKKDFMLRRECLRGIPYLGLTVGKQTLARYLLITCTQLLYDAEESVVFEMVKCLTKLLEFRLISKTDAFENLDKLLPFLLHPNTWIREETITFIKFLSDPKNEVLTQAESYCLVRPKIKKYLKKKEKIYQIFGDDLCLSKLKPALSREVYEKQIRGIGPSLFGKEQDVKKIIDAMQISDSDKESLFILKEVIENAKAYFQSFKRDKIQKEIETEYNNDFLFKLNTTPVFRIIQMSTLQQISGAQISSVQISQSPLKKKNSNEEGFEVFQSALDKEESKDYQKNEIPVVDYCETYFYPSLNIPNDEIKRTNFGLNKRVLNNQYPMNFEIDIVLQGLNLVPLDNDISIIAYKNLSKFTNLQNQSLILNSNLYLEQSSDQPQIIPQYHQGSKKVQIQVSFNHQQLYQLGQARFKVNNWRPTGRLITTLYEHKGPVNCLAISDDSSIFITGSKNDQSICVWSTSDIEKDVTSHSLFPIKTQRQVNTITMMENSYYFAVGSSQGFMDIYQISRLEQEAQQQSIMQEQKNKKQNQQSSVFANKIPSYDKGFDYNYTSIIKTIEKKDQGDINHCVNMILPIQQQHLLSYCTQRGSLYFHDLRARYDVMSQHELFGSQKGMISCMSIGQDPYQLYFGTLGGYILIYDVRYNIISQCFKHYQRGVIQSVVPFCPNKQSSLGHVRIHDNSPLALISSGINTYELSLVNLQTGDVEIYLTVDDTKNKENISQFTPVVPQFYKENLIENIEEGIKYETNSSLFRRQIQSAKLKFQQPFQKTQQPFKNLDEEWLKNSKNRYMLVKASFESQSICKKILVPRKYNNILHSGETVSYAITGGNDKKIRYWDFQALQKKSYQVNTPRDDECQYYAENLGDTYVVQEKINQFKQFPQITSQIAQKQFDGVLPTANLTLAGNSNLMKYQIQQLMQGQESNISEGGINAFGNSNNGGIRTSSFQYDTAQEQTTIFNYNGLAEWQHFNGLSMNQGCGINGGGFGSGADGQGSGEASGNIEYFYRESENVSHSDCILDMGIIEIVNQEPILVTCGRDSLIKLWR